jgi:hypothetical protein
MTRLGASLAALVAVCTAVPAAAQTSNWPTKPVRLVNTFAAAGLVGAKLD